MRCGALILTVAAAAAASLAGGTVAAAHTTAAAHTRDNGRRSAPAPQSRPQRLVDRSRDLVQPKAITVDRSLGAKRVAQEVHLAQELYTFWNTGRQKYLDAAISPRFKDNTLPTRRPQGPAGPLFASKNFRTAVPDLTCEPADLLVTGDKLTARCIEASPVGLLVDPGDANRQCQVGVLALGAGRRGPQPP